MKLTNPTDRELDVCFAEEMAGFVRPFELHEEYYEDGDSNGFINVLRDVNRKEIPLFTKSVDAVLPWLEECKEWHLIVMPPAMGESYLYAVVCGGDKKTGDYCCPSLARAAVIALLRAHGVEIEFK